MLLKMQEAWLNIHCMSLLANLLLATYDELHCVTFLVAPQRAHTKEVWLRPKRAARQLPHCQQAWLNNTAVSCWQRKRQKKLCNETVEWIWECSGTSGGTISSICKRRVMYRCSGMSRLWEVCNTFCLANCKFRRNEIERINFSLSTHSSSPVLLPGIQQVQFLIALSRITKTNVLSEEESDAESTSSSVKELGQILPLKDRKTYKVKVPDKWPAPVKSNMNVAKWESLMRETGLEDDIPYIVKGFTKGFCLGIPQHDLGERRWYAPENHTSALEAKDQINKTLEKEKRQGRIVSPEPYC